MKINFNDVVTVTLTEQGKRRYIAYVKGLGLPKYEQMNLERIANGTFQGTLWEVAQIFGPDLYQGGDLPFRMEIELER